MAETTTNGRPQRKQLSDQLDRLDGIIDALAEGLNQAVAEAAREGTRLAVKDAIIEILSNPELRALIAPQVTAPKTTLEPVPASTSAPAQGDGLRAKATSVAAAIGHVVKKAAGLVSNQYRAIRDGLAATARAAAEVVPVSRVLLVALGVGAIAGLTCLAAPHAVAAAVGAVGVAVVAVAAHVGSRLRRSARWLGLA